MAGPENTKQYVPLTCHGHSRPVTHISFSGFVDGKEDEYYMISACKGVCSV
jgi:serine-threonine kinase receptor-associated protein